MLRERAANEKVLHSFQQNGIASKVNTLCKLNKIIFALPSTLTSSPGNKSSMLQPALQPQRTSGAGMKCAESGQVLLEGFELKFASNCDSHEQLTICLHEGFSVLLCGCVFMFVCVW